VEPEGEALCRTSFSTPLPFQAEDSHTQGRELMIHSRSSGGLTRVAARRLAAVAGVGALLLGLGTPALADPPTGAPPMGNGMGADRMDAQPMDQHFMVMMIPHHRMGVMMASMAQTNSQHPQLLAMQQAMVKAQSQEIEQMAQWYRSWYGTP
jgi:uncharacterized protein (DUF305 family)